MLRVNTLTKTKKKLFSILINELSSNAYELNKNFKQQSNQTNSMLIICKKWSIKKTHFLKKNYFYEFLKMFDITKSYKIIYQATKIITRNKTKITFAIDDVENPGINSYFVSNAGQIANQINFPESGWTPGNITNNWWWDLNFKKKPQSSIIFLPSIETSLTYWRESQIKIVPMASLAPLNSNIKRRITYPILGSYSSNLIQIYFLSRFIGLLTR